MTEKATVEIGSPVAVKILSRRGEKGKLVSVGEELVTIATEEKEHEPAFIAATAPRQAETSPPKSRETVIGTTKSRLQHKPVAAPAVRARAVALGIDLATI